MLEFGAIVSISFPPLSSPRKCPQGRRPQMTHTAACLFPQTGQKRDQAAAGAVTHTQRFGTTANVLYAENWRAPAKDGCWPGANREPQWLKCSVCTALEALPNENKQTIY